MITLHQSGKEGFALQSVRQIFDLDIFVLDLLLKFIAFLF